MSETSIYLAGNGGWDRFSFENSPSENSPSVPSGVFFLKAGLGTLFPLPDPTRPSPQHGVVKIEAPSPSDEPPLMKAELKRFESDKIRIYNYQSLPVESKQTFHPPPNIPDEPTQRLLVIHHAAKVQDGSVVQRG